MAVDIDEIKLGDLVQLEPVLVLNVMRYGGGNPRWMLKVSIPNGVDAVEAIVRPEMIARIVPHAVGANDSVRVLIGPNRNRRGVVKHIAGRFAWVSFLDDVPDAIEPVSNLTPDRSSTIFVRRDYDRD